MRNGKGILYYSDGKIQYEGDFVNEKYEGKGKYIYENGRYYIDEFKSNWKHGKGILYYSDGKINYDGNFINDKINVNGKYIYQVISYYIG